MFVNDDDAVKAFISDAEKVLIVTHISPDGDAIGSLTAMGLALEQLGKQVTLACDDGCPARFDFLAMSGRVRQQLATDAKFALVIALDCGDMSRMGRVYEVLPDPKPPLINVDHHVTNTLFGDANVVDSEANSTTEILFGLLPELNVSMNVDLATSLLTGIVTDTLGFRTVGVTPRTFRAAGELMEAGADLSLVMMRALTIKPLSTLRLWQQGLNNMKMDDGLLWTSISEKERREVGHEGSSSGGLANMLANVNEAAMSAVLIESDDKVYVGFRCRPPFSVSELALNLGGGGHPLASGCTLDGPLEEAESLVVEMSRESLRRQRALFSENGTG